MKNKIILVVIVLIGFISTISPQQTFRRAVFLHQSVGSHIYQHAGASTDVPTEIAAYNTAHGYTGDDAVSMLKPDDYPTLGNMLWLWWEVFDSTSEVDDIYTDYINNSNYDIVIIKICFESQADIWWYWYEGPQDTINYPLTQSIYNYQWYVRKILKKMEQHPNTFFVWWNIPPHVEGETTPAYAANEYSFNKWMKDSLATGLDSYGDFPENVYIFDYFDIVESANFLPLSLADGPHDSHPNAACSELVAPLFVQETFNAAIAYEESLLPVELSSFSASIIGSIVKLNWKTETEVSNYGFDIERKAGSRLSEVGNFEKIGFVEGHGNSNSPKYYSFEDINLTTGKYSYRLKQIDTDGQFEYSKIIEVDLGSPMKYELSQNYPNPFNPVTTIQFSIPQAVEVKLMIYNILGEQVAELVNGSKEAGVYTINFNAAELNSGLYIYKLTAGSFSAFKKMMLLK